jgi:hypothetical protein
MSAAQTIEPAAWDADEPIEYDGPKFRHFPTRAARRRAYIRYGLDQREWPEPVAAPAARPLIAPSWNAYAEFDGPLEIPPTLFAVPGLGIGPGRPCGLIGDGGAGKNLTGQSIGLHVASGRKLWGLHDVVRGRVLILAYDAGRFSISLRNRQLANGLGLSAEELRDQVVVCPYPEINLATPGAGGSLRDLCASFALVILDNLRDAAPDDEENDSTFARHLKTIARACGTRTTCLYFHHTPVSDAGRPRGTGAIKAGSGALFSITGSGTEARTLTNTRAHECLIGLASTLTLTQHVDDTRGSFEIPRIFGAEGGLPRAVWLSAALAENAGAELAGCSAEQLSKVRAAIERWPDFADAEVEGIVEERGPDFLVLGVIQRLAGVQRAACSKAMRHLAGTGVLVDRPDGYDDDGKKIPKGWDKA